LVASDASEEAVCFAWSPVSRAAAATFEAVSPAFVAMSWERGGV
jgi:hypothetical protein